MKALFLLMYYTINYGQCISEHNTIPPTDCDGWDTMLFLADTIFERLVNPSGDGMDLIADVHSYFEWLEKLKKAIEKNKPGALKFLHTLREKGGPKHLLLHPDSTPLVAFFKWDKYATCQFAGFLEYTWILWRDLQAFMEMKEKNENWNSEDLKWKDNDFKTNDYDSASEVITLLELSLKLKKLIKKPEGETSYMLENLECFLNGFKQYSEKVYANDAKAIEDYHLINEEGGPHHIKLFPIDMMPLLKYYDWDSYDCWLFGGYLEKTKCIWYEISDYMEARKKRIKLEKWRERRPRLNKTEKSVYGS